MFAAVALVGCNREYVPVSPQEQHSIGFGTVDTRAGLSDLQANGFGVWALFYNEAQPTGCWLLDNEKVYLQDGVWTYDNTQLWVSNSAFGFFACYPQNVGFKSTTSKMGDDDDNNEIPVVALKDFETPDAADQDILVATTIVSTVDEYDETVPLTFKHLFSKVNIRIKQNKGTNERDNFIIDKITLRNAMTKGTCVAFKSEDMVWEDMEATKTFVKEIPGDDIIDFSTGILLSDEGLMLLPQTIAPNKVELEISFRVGLEGETDLNNFESKTYKAYLPNTVNWEAGKSYTYTAQVSTYNPITFLSPMVESWGGSQSGGTIIIK